MKPLENFTFGEVIADPLIDVLSKKAMRNVNGAKKWERNSLCSLIRNSVVFVSIEKKYGTVVFE